jgi:hypothetical protein
MTVVLGQIILQELQFSLINNDFIIVPYLFTTSPGVHDNPDQPENYHNLSPHLGLHFCIGSFYGA